jgi:hypothetical protein
VWDPHLSHKFDDWVHGIKTRAEASRARRARKQAVPIPVGVPVLARGSESFRSDASNGGDGMDKLELKDLEGTGRDVRVEIVSGVDAEAISHVAPSEFTAYAAGEGSDLRHRFTRGLDEVMSH